MELQRPQRNPQSQRETQSSALEISTASPQLVPKFTSDERRFTLVQAEDIFGKAAVLRRMREEHEMYEPFRQVMTERASAVQDESIGLSTMYEVAQQLGLPAEYLNTAISTRYPSAEQMRSDLEGFGEGRVSPTPELKAQRYNKRINMVESLWLDELRSADPSSVYSIKRGPKLSIWRRFLILSGLDAKSRNAHFYRETEGKAELLAHVTYNDIEGQKLTLDTHLHSPLFMSVCGKTLRKYSTEFSYIHHNYETEEKQ